MEFIAQLVLLLLLSRLFGEIATRLGQPSTVGELTAGIAIAVMVVELGTASPVLGPFLSRLASSDALQLVSNTAIFFLVLLAGIEMRPGDMARDSGASFLVAAGGVLVPLSAGFCLAWWLLPNTSLRQAQALLVGVVMSITSIPATVKIFGEFNLLQNKIGQIVVFAAIFDDVIGLFLLAVLTAIIETGHIPDLGSFALLLLKIGIFFAVIIGLGVHVYPHISRHLRALQTASVEFSILMAVALGYALFAEALGMHWILGAFAAGLFFEPSRVGAFAYNEMKLIVTGVTVGFFGPVFFASIGLRVDLSAIGAIPWFVAALIAVAFAGKLLGAGAPALWTGLGARDSAVVGVGMCTRGAVELIILGVAYRAGLFSQSGKPDIIVDNLFSALVLMIVVTTMITSVVLRRILR